MSVDTFAAASTGVDLARVELLAGKLRSQRVEHGALALLALLLGKGLQRGGPAGESLHRRGCAAAGQQLHEVAAVHGKRRGAVDHQFLVTIETRVGRRDAARRAPAALEVPSQALRERNGTGWP